MAREKAWGVAFARALASELPGAVRDIPDNLGLTSRQINQLRVAFENRLVQSMGEDSDETPTEIADRTLTQLP
jgi:hypothetical protein